MGCCVGVVKYGDSVLLVGGEDDKSWMAGMYSLSPAPVPCATGATATRSASSGEETGSSSSVLQWAAGQELPVVMSTFGCVAANVNKRLLANNDTQTHD